MPVEMIKCCRCPKYMPVRDINAIAYEVGRNNLDVKHYCDVCIVAESLLPLDSRKILWKIIEHSYVVVMDV